MPLVANASVATRWDDAVLAAQLFAVDPAALGGIVVRAGPSAVRDFWLEMLRSQLPHGTPIRKLPSGTADDRLLGGLDLAATLKAGRPIIQNGLLIEADRGVLLIPMAERMSAQTVARIAGVMDRHDVLIAREGVTRRISTHIGVVAFDEGVQPDETLPVALAERLAFHLDLDGLSIREVGGSSVSVKAASARARLCDVGPASDAIVEALVSAASHFGIASVVAPLLALRTARAAAALAGRARVTDEDALLAARLVLAPRASANPEMDENDSKSKAEQENQTQMASGHDDGTLENQNLHKDALDDVMRDAVRSALPPGLLDLLKNDAKQPVSSHRHGAGATQFSLLRGRPVGVRLGPLRSGGRLALVETLRAAAPWQPVRRAEVKFGNRVDTKRIDVRREDFRVKKFSKPRESTIIFCVDASGSAAFHRLAEAKGAVELLLGEAYAARTYAALIAFRGVRAELLLPSSRSLTRARALLSTLPGGGGTPLAGGIEMATCAALAERAKGRTPLIVFLTDGHANVTRDGTANRSRAFDEAMGFAARLGAERLNCVFIDTAQRIRTEGRQLADAMGARYLALPHAQATAMRDVIRVAMP